MEYMINIMDLVDNIEIRRIKCIQNGRSGNQMTRDNECNYGGRV